MKPRTLASIGAVLLYLWCEVLQASPFLPTGPAEETVGSARQLAPTKGERNELREGLGELFEQAELIR